MKEPAVASFLLLVVALIGSAVHMSYSPAAETGPSPAGTVLLAGVFETPDPTHPASGSFSVVSDGNGGRTLHLSEDFSIVAGAPEPRIRVNRTIIATPRKPKGAQAYLIPESIGRIKKVDAWCEAFSVPLANGVISK